VELFRIAQVTGVQGGLDVLDVVDVLLGVLAELIDVELLEVDYAADIVRESFPLGVLVADDTLDQVGEGGLVLVILDHT